jgi:hypothetical protein
VVSVGFLVEGHHFAVAGAVVEADGFLERPVGVESDLTVAVELGLDLQLAEQPFSYAQAADLG